MHWTVIDQCSDIHDIRYLPPLSPGAYFPTFDIDGVQFVVRHLRHTGAAAARPVRVEIDGRAEVLSVAADAAIGADAGCAVWVNGPRGQVRFDIAPRFAEVGTGITVGGPISPMPGTVLDIMVEPGQAVYPGDPLVVVEAMKMEHVVKAAADAIVSRVLVQVGQAVDAGRILVEFETVK